MPLAQLPRRCVRYLIAIWENELARSCVQICVQDKRKSSYERARNCLVFNLWSHLYFELQGNLLWDNVFCMLKIGLGSDEAPLYFIILQRRSYLRLCKFNHYLSQCQISHIKSS